MALCIDIEEPAELGMSLYVLLRVAVIDMD